MFGFSCLVHASRVEVAVMRSPAERSSSVAASPTAACGGNREGAATAAVEKTKKQREAPDGFFGHRNGKHDC